MPKLEFYNDHSENVEPVLLAVLESDFIPEKGKHMWLGDQRYEVNHITPVIDYAGTAAARLRIIIRLFPRGQIKDVWDIYKPKLAKDLVNIEWRR